MDSFALKFENNVFISRVLDWQRGTKETEAKWNSFQATEEMAWVWNEYGKLGQSSETLHELVQDVALNGKTETTDGWLMWRADGTKLRDTDMTTIERRRFKMSFATWEEKHCFFKKTNNF